MLLGLFLTSAFIAIHADSTPVKDLNLKENTKYCVQVLIIKNCGAHLTTVEEEFSFSTRDDDDNGGGGDKKSGDTFDTDETEKGRDDDDNNRVNLN